MNKNRFILIIFSVFIIAVSCNKDIAYEQYAEIADGQWAVNDIKTFEVPMHDTLQSYDVFLMLRNNGEYPWRNIHLFVTTTSPAGQQVKDTVEYYLADEMGRWLGSGWGSIWTNKLPYRLNVRFPYKGIYQVKIQHGMRTEQLPGILDVGILIRRHKEQE